MRVDPILLTAVMTVAVALLAAYFAFLQARAATKPRIVISLLDDVVFDPGEEARLTFNLRNSPYLHSRPIATNVTAYVNVNPPIEPIRLRFGSVLSNVDTMVKSGKDNSRYLKASGIVLLPNQSESVELHARTPNAIGRYRVWLDVITAEGSSTTFLTQLEVRSRAAG